MANKTLPLVNVPVAGGNEDGYLPLGGTAVDGARSAALDVLVRASSNAFGATERIFAYPQDGSEVVADATQFLLGAAAFPKVFDGTNWEAQRGAYANNLAPPTGRGAALSANPGEFGVYHAPAAATRATITYPTLGAVRLVCRSITACLVCDGTAESAARFVYLRDGASGVGPILWAGVLRGGANANGNIFISGLNIVGSENTSMTLEFDSAPDAGHNQTVALTGYIALL